MLHVKLHDAAVIKTIFKLAGYQGQRIIFTHTAHGGVVSEIKFPTWKFLHARRDSEFLLYSVAILVQLEKPQQ